MKHILSSSLMKSRDELTIKNIGIPSMVLMERASLAMASLIEKRMIRKNKKAENIRLLAVCGSGNNGGDGVACARILHQRGFRTDIMLVGRSGKRSPELEAQLGIAERLRVPLVSEPDMSSYDVIIDALFGIGLSREVEASSGYAEAIRAINASGAFVVSADIPSGISADSGQVLGCAVRADVTVTMQYLKIGHLLYPGADYAGEVRVADIGIAEPELMFDAASCRADERASSQDTGQAGHFSGEAFSLEEQDLSLIPKRRRDGHKGTFGKVLIIAGSKNMCGAALLACRACLKTGAGMVRLLTCEANRLIVQASLPEVMLNTYSDEKEALEELSKALSWADVVACGPGIGQSRAAQLITETLLKNDSHPLILDADGLNVLKGRQALLKAYRGQLLITPHAGEMSRLTGKSTGEILADPLREAWEMAENNQISCLLKGAATLIASQGEIYINQSGNSGMATAGSGDVLTGIAAGLAAVGTPFNLVGALAAYLHGRAGERASEIMGEAGVTASDIIDQIRLLPEDDYAKQQNLR